MSKFVQLRPYNPKQGHVMRSYTAAGVRFRAGGEWFEVDDDLAAYLKEVKQEDTEPNSPLAFLVLDDREELDEYLETLKERESRAAAPPPQASPRVRQVTGRARASKPGKGDTGTVTTDDLPKVEFDKQRDDFSDDMSDDDAPTEEPAADAATSEDPPPNQPPAEAPPQRVSPRRGR